MNGHAGFGADTPGAALQCAFLDRASFAWL
jgi:hypothetical protein